MTNTHFFVFTIGSLGAAIFGFTIENPTVSLIVFIFHPNIYFPRFIISRGYMC